MDSMGLGDADTYIRDPIHGEIGLSQMELDILDEKPVQRLRQIKQLGAVSKVYPSATHTRFSHCLGVMHMAGLMGNVLELSDKEISEIRIAGLLHDTGHGPFSHDSEQVCGVEQFDHEEVSCEIADSICDNYPIDGDNIKDHISGNAKYNVVSGVVDVDKLDYLSRDSVFTGVDHGLVDSKSIVRFSERKDGEVCFDRKAVPSLNNMIAARLRMKRVVYRYPTCRHMATILQRAMEEFIQDTELDKVLGMDDYEMHTSLVGTDNSYYEQYQIRDLARKRIQVGSDLTRKEIRKISESEKSVVRNAVSKSAGVDVAEVLVSLPIIPQKISDEIRIVSDGNQTKLDSLSTFPSSIYEEAWNETSMVIYVPKHASEAAVRESILNIL